MFVLTDARIRCARLIALSFTLSAFVSRPAPAQAPPPAGADLRLVRCEEERIGTAPGKLLLHVTVKNAGPGQSVDALLHAKFLDPAGTFLAEAYAPLADGRVAPGAEESFTVAVADCPDYRRLLTAVIWETQRFALPDGGLTSAPALEVGDCLFQRFSNGDLRVTGRVRNGLATPAKGVEVGFEFKNGEGKAVRTIAHRIEGVIPAGVAVPFLRRIPECPAIASVSTSVADGGAGPEGPELDAAAKPLEDGLAAEGVRLKAPAAKASGGAPAAEGGLADAVGPAAGRREPPAAPPAAAPAVPDPAAAPYAIRVDGLVWKNGTYKTAGSTSNYQYTGDTAFLKLMFTDAKGAPAKPEATVVVKVTDREKPAGFCKRPITKTSWKLDADAITTENVVPEIVAYSAKDGALWVGLVRAPDSEQTVLALDVSVEIKKYGAWTWKGLRDPWKTMLAPPEPPADKTKKK
jgi:hypothetical protein